MENELLLKMPPALSEQQLSDCMAKQFNAQPKRKPQSEKLTARQQFILELLKATIAANGGLTEAGVQMAARSADVVFGG